MRQWLRLREIWVGLTPDYLESEDLGTRKRPSDLSFKLKGSQDRYWVRVIHLTQKDSVTNGLFQAPLCVTEGNRGGDWVRDWGRGLLTGYRRGGYGRPGVTLGLFLSFWHRRHAILVLWLYGAGGGGYHLNGNHTQLWPEWFNFAITKSLNATDTQRTNHEAVLNTFRCRIWLILRFFVVFGCTHKAQFSFEEWLFYGVS